MNDIEQKMKKRIKRASQRYDDADKVYHELFRKDEDEVLMKVIKDKEATFKRNKDK